jgi:hypothetical protein
MSEVRVTVEPSVSIVPRVEPVNGTPPNGFTSWCEWAQDGLRRALEGMAQSGGGVLEYHIGSRGLKRSGPADQQKNVDYWNQLVEFYCGVPGLPTSITGRDTACRVIPRDV